MFEVDIEDISPASIPPKQETIVTNKVKLVPAKRVFLGKRSSKFH